MGEPSPRIDLHAAHRREVHEHAAVDRREPRHRMAAAAHGEIRSLSRAKFTASTTSAVPEQLATSAGSPSCIALNSARTSA